MWSEFNQLQHAWSSSRHAKGGIAALSGFSYQLLCSLLQLVRATAPERGHVFFEALSDIVTSDGGYVVVIQAKLTLRSSELQKALKELWDIDCLARSRFPSLATNLRYRVLTSANALKAAEAVVARWAPDMAVPDGLLDEFRRRALVSVEPDPEIKLAVHLVNTLENASPFATIENWLGMLLADPSIAGFEHAIQKIITELEALEAAKRERASRFYIWRSEDQPPDTPRRETNIDRAVLTGQTPTRIDLAEGCFASRRFYGRLHQSAESWIENVRNAGSSRLQVFWISGRSGSGKSVALLHLLSKLFSTDERRIIVLLDRNAHRIDEAIRWARPFFAKGLEVILASDDPYTPERYQRVAESINAALAEWASVSSAHPQSLRPILVFCGPTEQRQYFEDDLSDQALVEPFEVPHGLHEDITELRRWYQLRTGRTDFQVDDVDNTLIVQLFFEWTSGEPIRAFALRFRRRLEGMDRSKSQRSVFDLVAKVLALNRLYAPFPATAIKQELESDVCLGVAFDRLRNEERHFSFDFNEGGYKLTHPHLANAIYSAWFGRDADRRFRKSHLRAAIHAALHAEQSPSRRFDPLWAIARMSSGRARAHADGAERLELIAVELRELLTELYTESFAKPEHPLTDLPVWENLDKNLGLGLQPRPIHLLAEAARSADERDAGLRLACHTLIKNADRAGDAQTIVACVLSRFPRWHEWASVAAHFVESFGPSELGDALLTYIEREGARPSTRKLVDSCIRHSHDDTGRFAGQTWLRATTTADESWAGVFEEYAKAFGVSADDYSLGWRFIKEQQNHAGWSHVWERLYSAPLRDRQALLLEARAWLSSSQPEISGWDRVWERLWKESGNCDEGLRSLGLQWLERVLPGHTTWCRVWNPLLSASKGSDSELLKRGRRWLDEVPFDNDGWTYVWQELFKRNNADAELRQMGQQWLDAVCPTHLSWSYVWKDLWCAAGDEIGKLQASGRRWLETVPISNRQWLYVWEVLWEFSGETDAELRASALRWLDETDGEHAYWGNQWTCLAKSGAPDAFLEALGRRWLSQVSDTHGSWGHVWQELWKRSGMSDAVLRGYANRWLAVSFEHHRWTYVWESLFASLTRSDSRVQELGLRWLRAVAPERRGWGHVWKTIWRGAPKAPDVRFELMTLAKIWLKTPGLKNPSWSNVWCVVWDHDVAERQSLAHIARRLLVEAPPRFPQNVLQRVQRLN